MPSALSPWKCPACDRRVPSHVGECRCGYTRHEAGTATTPAVDERPTQSREWFAAKMAAATLIAAAAVAGAIWYPVRRLSRRRVFRR